MARFAIVRNGKVRDIVEADPGFAAQFIPNAVQAHDGVHIGDLYDGVNTFSRSPREINKEARTIKQTIREALRKSDWTVDPDNTLNQTKRDAWKVWRQSLRTVIRTYDNTALADFVLPDPPGEYDEF